jgi:peroxiredoxin
LQAYNEAISRIRKGGGSLVGISPMLPARLRELKTLLDPDFELLSDPGNAAAKRLDLAYRVPEWIADAYERIGRKPQDFNGVEHWELPLTAAFAVGRDRRIKFAWREGDYTRRPELKTIAMTLFS